MSTPTVSACYSCTITYFTGVFLACSLPFKVVTSPLRYIALPSHLKVFGWVPVMFNKDYCVGSREAEAKPSDMGREEKEVNGWVGVEAEQREDCGSCDSVPSKKQVFQEKVMQVTIRCT